MTDIVKVEIDPDNDEQVTDATAGLEEGYEEAASQLTSMLEEAGADEDSSDEYKRGFFLGYAAFFAAWLEELENARKPAKGNRTFN